MCAVVTDVSGKLDKSGGTMTGALNLTTTSRGQLILNNTDSVSGTAGISDIVLKGTGSATGLWISMRGPTKEATIQNAETRTSYFSYWWKRKIKNPI
jgi:hypothetical protein